METDKSQIPSVNIRHLSKEMLLLLLLYYCCADL